MSYRLVFAELRELGGYCDLDATTLEDAIRAAHRVLHAYGLRAADFPDWAGPWVVLVDGDGRPITRWDPKFGEVFAESAALGRA